MEKNSPPVQEKRKRRRHYGNWIILLVVCSLPFCVYSLYYDGVLFLLDKTQVHLEEMTSSHLSYSGFDIDFLKRSVRIENAVFRHKEKEAHLKTCLLYFGWPDFGMKRFPISLTLIAPELFIYKVGKKFQYFPDFFHQEPHYRKKGTEEKSAALKGKRKKWQFPVTQILFQDGSLYFNDQEEGDFSFHQVVHGTRIIYSTDALNEKGELKGFLDIPSNSKSSLYVDHVWERWDPKNNYNLVLQGKNIELSPLSYYQYPFSKCQIKGGTGTFALSLRCSLGMLNGYSYMKLSELNLDAFNEGIFSTILGLSSAGFFSILEKNNNLLELDFHIRGTAQNPVAKLGDTSKNFILQTPVSVAKDALNLVEGILNTALLGIPRKIFQTKPKNE
jgi:hypothetical protein